MFVGKRKKAENYKKPDCANLSLRGKNSWNPAYQLNQRRFFRRWLVKWPFKSVDLDSIISDGYSGLRGFTMSETTERRSEQRLRYCWPVWFAEDFNDVLSQGQMVDISSSGASFTCYDDGSCPYLGQHITTRFSVPRLGSEDSFDMENFTRSGHISRIDEVNNYLRRVVIQFAEPLPFKPGEQAEGEIKFGSEEVLETVEA